MKNFLNFINEEEQVKNGLEHGRTVGRTHAALSHLKYKVVKDEEHENRWHLEDESGKVVASVSGQNHAGAVAALRDEGYDV